MRDFALQAGGALAILVAIAHGAIAELRVFDEIRGAEVTSKLRRTRIRGIARTRAVMAPQQPGIEFR